MQNIPYELQFDYLLKLEYSDLINICQANKELSEICNTEYLWKRLVLRDYPDLFRNTTNYKQLYLEFYHWDHKLFEDYPSLYRFREPNERYDQFYQGIEAYILSLFNDKLASDLNFNLDKELSKLILKFAKNYSNVLYNDNFKLKEYYYRENLNKKFREKLSDLIINYFSSNVINTQREKEDLLASKFRTTEIGFNNSIFSFIYNLYLFLNYNSIKLSL